jgi:hypothetical protein
MNVDIYTPLSIFLTPWIYGLVDRCAANTFESRVRSPIEFGGVLEKSFFLFARGLAIHFFCFYVVLAMPNHMQINAKPK